MNVTAYKRAIDQADSLKRYGKVLRAVGLMIESRGPEANIGEVCYIHQTNQKTSIMAEIVGFKDETMMLMPYASIHEIGPGFLV